MEISLRNKKILVIDDEKSIVDIVKSILHIEGAEAEGVTKPEKAIDTISKGNFDMIILDHHMKEVKGQELLKKLKGDAATKDVPVVMLTGEKATETIQTYIKMGAEGYIVKPFKPDDFIKQLLKILERRSGQYRVG